MTIYSSYPVFPSKNQKGFWLAVVLMLAAPALYALFAHYLGQDANWDLRNYHWYNAYAFVTHRDSLDLLPSQLPFFYNPLLDVPFYLLATFLKAQEAYFILAFVQGLNIVLLFMIAHASLMIANSRTKIFVCAALAALGVTGAGAYAQIGTTFYDNITSLGFLLSTLVLVRFIETLYHGTFSRSAVIALMAGLPAGVMMGLKLPSVIFCVGLCGALFMATGNLKRRFWVSFFFGIGVLIGLAASFTFWGMHLQETYQSPLFPYFNEIFKSPYLPPTSMRDVKFLPSGFFDAVMFPFAFSANSMRTGEILWQDFRLLVWYVLLPASVFACLAFGRKTARPDRLAAPYAARFLQWTALVTYLTWLVMFSIYRYVVPLEMLMPLLIVLALGLFPMKLHTRVMLACLILTGLVLVERPGDWGRQKPWFDQVAPVTVPALENPEKMMILMTGFEPYSHVIPSFPPEIAFVRIQSNFASPDEGKGINLLLEKRVAEHKKKGGNFKVFVTEWQKESAKIALKHFGFTFLPQTCQKIDDKLFDAHLSLCDVKENKS